MPQADVCDGIVRAVFKADVMVSMVTATQPNCWLNWPPKWTVTASSLGETRDC